MALDKTKIQKITKQRLSVGISPLHSHYLTMSTERIRIPIIQGLLEAEDAGDDALITQREEVWDAETPEELMELFSKQIFFCHFDALLLKATFHVREFLPLLERAYYSTNNEELMKNAVHFFLRLPRSLASPLISYCNYVQNPVAKAYLYLVIGIRGDEKTLEFLYDQWCALEEDALSPREYQMCRDALILSIYDGYLQVFEGGEYLGSL